MKKMTKAQQAERQEALEFLRSILKPGDTVFTTVHTVARSGMSRTMSVYKLINDDRICLNYYIEALGHERRNDQGQLKVSGCGMDMGFAVVYSLSRALFPEGFPVIGVGRNGDMSGHDSDGGYALRQRWL